MSRRRQAAAPPPRRAAPRGRLFAGLVALCLLLAGGSVAWAGLRGGPDIGSAAARGASPPAQAATNPGVPSAPAGATRLLILSTDPDSDYGRALIAPLAGPEGLRAPTPLACERIHYAAGQGVCLEADRGVVTTYRARTFGPDFQPRHTIPLGGSPSRARVSPDGRHAAITVFVSGHSYAAPGSFSTQTTLVDLASGAVIGDLEQFTVRRDGGRVQAPDMNFWGVTFARDSNRFYATLATGGKTYLIAGDVAAREARVLRENVECPSLSPDNTRIAYKKQVGTGGRAAWRIGMLDLATMAETVLAAETRSVDDQVEWLDDGHVLYALPDDARPAGALTNVWMLPSDGNGTPQLLLPRAFSPAVLR